MTATRRIAAREQRTALRSLLADMDRHGREPGYPGALVRCFAVRLAEILEVELAPIAADQYAAAHQCCEWCGESLPCECEVPDGPDFVASDLPGALL